MEKGCPLCSGPSTFNLSSERLGDEKQNNRGLVGPPGPRFRCRKEQEP